MICICVRLCASAPARRQQAVSGDLVAHPPRPESSNTEPMLKVHASVLLQHHLLFTPHWLSPGWNVINGNARNTR